MAEQRSGQLVASVIAATTADPIPQSVARVVPSVAKRLGYALVGVRQHCTDAVVVRAPAERHWVHRDHGTPSCLRDRSRYGTATLLGETSHEVTR